MKILSLSNEYNGETKRKIIEILGIKIKFRVANKFSAEYLIKKNKWKYEIQIETTSFCNAKCSFCPNSSLIRKKNFMSDEIFNKIIERIKKEKINVERFILHLNGEPFTDKKLFKRIETLHNNFPNSKIRFTTNFALADKTTRERLLASPIDEITISLNSIDAEEYTQIMGGVVFENTIRNIDDFFEEKEKNNRNIVINISIVSRPDNTHMVELFKEKYRNKANIRVIKLGQWVNKEKTMNCNDKNNIEKKVCSILYKTIAILSNGDYALCCFDAEGIIKKNIMTSPILQTYFSGVYKKIRIHHKRKGKINKECKNCSFS